MAELLFELVNVVIILVKGLKDVVLTDFFQLVGQKDEIAVWVSNSNLSAILNV